MAKKRAREADAQQPEEDVERMDEDESSDDEVSPRWLWIPPQDWRSMANFLH